MPVYSFQELQEYFSDRLKDLLKRPVKVGKHKAIFYAFSSYIISDTIFFLLVRGFFMERHTDGKYNTHVGVAVLNTETGEK